jgi:hypothetical protein
MCQSGYAFDDLEGHGQLYPSVGLKTPGEAVKANFGQQPFKFDIDGFVLVRRTFLSLPGILVLIQSSFFLGTEASYIVQHSKHSFNQIVLQPLDSTEWLETGCRREERQADGLSGDAKRHSTCGSSSHLFVVSLPRVFLYRSRL